MTLCMMVASLRSGSFISPQSVEVDYTAVNNRLYYDMIAPVNRLFLYVWD
jgi:hypothetical protein